MDSWHIASSGYHEELMMTRADDDVGIDISRYARHLVRHWFVVVAVTLLGGAIGWGAARMRTPMYLGVARLTVMQVGSGVANDAIVAYQAALQRDDVLATAISRLEGAAASITPEQLRAGLSWRRDFPPSTFMVELKWSDAYLATRLARAVADAALEAARLEHVKQIAELRELLRTENDAGDRAIEKARAELAEFRAANAKVLAVVRSVVLTPEQETELDVLDGEIPAERARLAATEADLAKLTESPALREELLKRASASRAQLAGLEAKRAHLSGMAERAMKRESELPMLYAIEQRESILIAQLTVLQRNSSAVRLSQKLGAIDILQVIDAPLTAAAPVVDRGSALPRGLASGLVLSVFGVLFLRGFRSR
jgi:hypothetical protein